MRSCAKGQKNTQANAIGFVDYIFCQIEEIKVLAIYIDITGIYDAEQLY